MFSLVEGIVALQENHEDCLDVHPDKILVNDLGEIKIVKIISK
jgi:hypothetical protein